MSLRSKVFILVSGSLIVPIAVFLISFGLDTDIASIRQYRALIDAHRAWRTESRVIDLARIEESFAGVPDEFEVWVMDADREVLYRKVSNRSFEVTGKLALSETIEVEFTSGAGGFVRLIRPVGPLYRNEERWYVPLTGLFFVAVMAIAIVQSVNRSISNLEKATRKIAEGDLEFELPIQGRDKLASLTRSFDRMREHLKEEYSRRSRFIMGISHDLKTPLASIGGYTKAIREGYAETPGQLDRYLGIIENKTDLLESRISMLIDYVKRETTEWKMNLLPVELESFFSETSRMYEAEVDFSNRSYIGRVAIDAGVSAPMDEEMMIRAMENLMKNALAYSPEHSVIRFDCRQTETHLVVSLSNEGPGIAPADLLHVFEPFVRGSRDRKGHGLGLGLATVQSVIASHGWHISVTSEAGLTVFTIRVPVSAQ